MLAVRRQRKPCRRSVGVSAARRGRQTTKHAVQIERVHRQLMSVSPRCTSARVRIKVLNYKNVHETDTYSLKSTTGKQTDKTSTVYKPSTTPSSNTSLFPAATLHRHWYFSDRPEILSAHMRSSEIILSAYNTTLSSLLDKHAPIVNKLSRRQSPSFKPMVYCYPSCISVHPPPR